LTGAIEMGTSDIKFSIRSLLRNKEYSLINITGLAIGLACCILISLYVINELSYDKYHKNADNIYRLTWHGGLGDQVKDQALTPYALGSLVKSYFPEVSKFARLCQEKQVLIRSSFKKKFNERIAWVDNSLFEIFDFPFIYGNPSNALTEKNTVVLSKTAAEKYFGNINPVGKELRVGTAGNNYKITGVIEDIPRNSHFKFDIFLSLPTLDIDEASITSLLTYNFYTYLLMSREINTHDTGEKITQLMKKIIAPYLIKYGVDLGETGAKKLKYRFDVQPLASIHLNSHKENEIEENNDIKNNYLLTVIALSILAIGCINYINLSTAKATTRAKEVGIRKAAGAGKKDLVRQFLGETFLMVFIAIIFALVISGLSLPAFNALSDKEFGIGDIFQPIILVLLLGVFLVVGLSSGVYPAFYLSKFKASEVLKPALIKGIGHGLSRKILVVLQFIISIVLIIATFVISSQINYMKNKKLGFKTDQQLVLKLTENDSREKYDAIKTELLKNPKILNADEARHLFFDDHPVNPFLTSDSKSLTLHVYEVGYNFRKNLQIQMSRGRDFSRSMTTDQDGVVILNKAAVKYMGWSDPIGKILLAPTEIPGKTQKVPVIGVVEDFNFLSLRSKIEPLGFLLIRKGRLPQFIVSTISTDNVSETIAYAKSVLNKVAPNQPFEYYFLDSKFDSLYKSEEELKNIVKVFSVVSIFIACIGLLGLASHSAERRTKEIGIRKAIGANISDIFELLVSDLTKWVLLANLIAWPVAYWIMNKWLQNFAYRITIGIGPFIISALIAFVIAFIAVSYQALKASLANPINSLRYE
jgi:putative ABC transport system permease protein